MRAHRVGIMVALAAAFSPAVASADPLGRFRPVLDRLAERVMGAGLTALRSEMEVTWDHLSVSTATGEIAVIGITVHPYLPWDFDNACHVRLDRLDLTSAGTLTADGPLWIDLHGLSIAAACLAPEARLMLMPLGIETLAVDHAGVAANYDLGSSALDLSVGTALRGIGGIEASVAFDYVWPEGWEGGTGLSFPAALLREAEIVFEDDGLFARMVPLMADAVGPAGNLPAAAEAGVRDLLAETPMGRRPLDPAAERFASSVGAALRSFVARPERLALRLAPDEPVWLEPRHGEDLQHAVRDFAPVLDTVTRAALEAIDPALLQGDPAALSPADRLRLGSALARGVGAPRAPDEARRILAPLVAAWNGEAALLLAEALGREGAGPDALAEAYGAALVAAATGRTPALAIIAALGPRLPVRDRLAVQAQVYADWPDREAAEAARADAVASGDARVLRHEAMALTTGLGMPLNLAEGYALALLAASGGDRAALALRDQIERRLAGVPEDDRAAVDRMRADAEERAVASWRAGFGAAVAAGGR